MICPVCKLIAKLESNNIVEETETKEIHEIIYYCRNPKCSRYKKKCGSETYEVDKPQPVEDEEELHEAIAVPEEG